MEAKAAAKEDTERVIGGKEAGEVFEASGVKVKADEVQKVVHRLVPEACAGVFGKAIVRTERTAGSVMKDRPWKSLRIQNAENERAIRSVVCRSSSNRRLRSCPSS